MSFRKLVTAAALLGLPLSGCTSGFIPEGGPSQLAASQTAAVQVGSTQEQTNLPFVLVAPSLELARSLPGEPDRFGSLPRRAPAQVSAKVGDVVLVTIFEAGSGGLFTSPQAAGNSGGGGNYINLPAQQIDRNGNISVPYAGQISVVGRGLPAVQAEIEEKLKQRAIEPQVVLTMQEDRASLVSVIGSVKAGGQFPVRNTQMRILDAVAKAGGPEGTSRSLEVVLQRGSHSSRISMRRLMLDPAANAAVLPGDTLYVQPVSRSLNVFGASGENLRVDIDVDNMSLTDALGRAKGFNDTRADISSIFVLRMEDRRVIPADTENLAHFTSAKVPTVYQIRYDTPGGIFVGNQFKVRHGDVVYISNAAGTQLRKLLELVGLVTRPAREIQGGFIPNY